MREKLGGRGDGMAGPRGRVFERAAPDIDGEREISSRFVTPCMPDSDSITDLLFADNKTFCKRNKRGDEGLGFLLDSSRESAHCRRAAVWCVPFLLGAVPVHCDYI